MRGRVSVDELSRQGLLKVAEMLYCIGHDGDGGRLIDPEIASMPTDELREVIRADVAAGMVGLVRVENGDPGDFNE